MHMSRHYDAHIVPDVTTELRSELVRILTDGQFGPHDGGVYVQTAGPRFETKAEVRFFAQFGVSALWRFGMFRGHNTAFSLPACDLLCIRIS